MKSTTLYHDDVVEFEKFPDGTYRVTFFNRQNHWAGDISFDKDGLIEDNITE